MKYLKIQNDGLLDIRLVALMGGTTKSNDKYKIGQFGTGLKYTLAYLFRSNLSFKIFVGNQEIKLYTETENIRGDDFEIICINGQRTSITTKMGEDWSAWMIVRELWCNALDEGGAAKDIVFNPEGEENKTTFYIQIDNQIQAVLNKWSKYFIHDQTPIFKDSEHALYPAGDKFCIYKQGVLIYENEELKSVFSYDISYADINELREFKGSPAMVVTYCLCDANEKAVEYFLENIQDYHFEAQDTTDYNWFKSFGASWKNVIGKAKIIHQKALDDCFARGNNPDVSDFIIVPKVLYRKLIEEFSGIGAIKIASEAGEFYEEYSKECESKIKQGLTILESCDYPIHPSLQFVYGFFEDKRIMAQVLLDEKKVYISNTFIQKPLFSVVAMLIEENEHFNTGMSDKTREFQQHFIDLYTRQLLANNKIEI